jgi:phage baseplate assembly protein W
MIGIDRKTGRRITGFDQLASRIVQVMTTPKVGRAKRPTFGSDVRQYMGANMSDSMLIRLQAAAIAAFYEPINGLTDFVPSRCVAKRLTDGLALYFEGKWNGQTIKFEVPLDVSTSKSTA